MHSLSRKYLKLCKKNTEYKCKKKKKLENVFFCNIKNKQIFCLNENLYSNLLLSDKF